LTDAVTDLKRPSIVSAAWLLLWIAAAAWTCQLLATSWPYVQLMPQWLLLFAAVGILFRIFDLAWMRWRRERLSGWTRRGARVVTFVAGAFAAGGLWEALDGISMGRFERAFAPLVAQVQAKAAAPCPPAATYAIDPGLAAYLEDAAAPRAPAQLHFDKQRFVLALSGWSMDIDGSTLFYDSRARAWRKVHNDMLAQSGELVNLRKGLESCGIELRR